MWNNFLNPKTISLIGASNELNSVGFSLAKNLKASQRKVFFVNPNKKKILGKKTYPDINSIKEKIDLAIIAVPAKIVPLVAKQCIQKKVSAVIIISAGFSEVGKKGKAIQQKIETEFKKAKIPFIGPNCLGIIRPLENFNASFAPAIPRPGNIAFLSQSGALIDSVIGISLEENIGFSLLASLGNEAGLKVSDFLEFLKKDKKTEIIAIYIEGLKPKQGKAFIEAAKRTKKKIILLKGGRTKKGAQTAYSHTGTLAGEAKIYSAGFKKAGIIEAETISDLLNIISTLSKSPTCLGNSIGVLTNGGAIGVLVNDWLDIFGVKVAEYNDILGDACSKDYEKEIKRILSKKNIKGLIVCQTVQSMTNIEEISKIISRLQKRYSEKPILNLLIGGKLVIKGERIFKKNLLPYFQEPRDVALAMKSLISKV